ncbi:hypothetical protein VC83_08730 [Pseudogymnoascus destructans]|uniref:Uncharacterized protein n=2 Tax=Pseudogymnoascus destructans TaxID=655981 RepID=L8GBY7_PSED2|nr:uncharacterized protein VC83_08730 [Pseudogymnoascus destructans]ELR09556.1 hypothetical protein GMDG_04051 [Pseudogymnoascus destructans 20631-21]OAF55041.1 hypothetical protein VC83_08730 [Pseudogymnoascus destructans]
MDVSDRDSSGQTPLHYAAMKGHADIVQTLLDHGADHGVEDKTDYTALDLAIHYRHSNVIKILADMPISAPSPTDNESYNSDEEDEDWEEIKTVSHKGYSESVRELPGPVVWVGIRFDDTIVRLTPHRI